MKRKRTQKAIAIVAASTLFCITAPVWAADNKDGAKDNELAPVIVTAEKAKEQTAEKAEEQTPVYNRLAIPASSKASTETFTRKDIEAMHPKSVPEILERGTGLTGSRWGGKGYFKIESRGGDSIGIVIDGVYFPDTQASRVLANLPVDMIESITIVRDASVVTLGPMANIATNFATAGAGNQGFIIIKTLDIKEDVTKTKVSYGTFNTQKYSLVNGAKLGDTAYYALAYSKEKSDGKDDWNNYRNFNTYFAKYGDRGKDWFADMTVFVNRGKAGLQEGFNLDGSFSSENMTSRWDPINTTIFMANTTKLWDEHHTTNLSFGYSSVRSDFIYKDSPTSTVYNDPNPQNEYLRELNLVHTLNFGKNTLKFGTQNIWWHSPTGVQGVASYEREEELYSYYVYGERKVDPKLTLDAGARVDKKHVTKGVAKYLSGRSNTAYDEAYGGFWEGNATSLSLGAAYEVNPIYKLSSRFSYSDQPAGRYLLTENNELLDSEKRYKYETGVTANYSKAFNVALTAFRYDIDNARVSTGNSYLNPVTHLREAIYTQKNLTREGFELAVTGQWSPTLGYKASYANFTSSDTDDSSYSPHNTYKLALDYKKDTISANISLFHVSKFTSSIMGGSLGGYTMIDANISKDLNATTKLTVYGHNIGDQRCITGVNTAYYFDAGHEYGIEISKRF